MIRWRMILLAGMVALAGAPAPGRAAEGWRDQLREGDWTIPNFAFKSGETLPALRLHYATLGEKRRDAAGRVVNAILVLHGTGGSGRQFFRPQFADLLFGPGQPLDVTRWFVILPDAIGHGKSAKPSDGLHAHFPHYDYDDMVEAQYRLVTEGLGTDHLHLVMGTSMGCMHAFVWGEAHPGAMDGLMPLACLTVPIAGRNRLWRQMVMDAIRSDPAWRGGDYAEEPAAGLRAAEDLLIIAGSAPLQMQKSLPTRDAADRYLADRQKADLAGLDANDLLYQVDASRNYDPSPNLGRITARVLWINSADDFINPPELGIAETEIRKLPNARFVLLPISEQTHGHATHSWAAAWQDRLVSLLGEIGG